jgi:hypothetical protein
MENQDNINEDGFTSQFSPLEENVVKRDYTKPNVQIEDVSPIEEPIFTTPSFEELDRNFQSQLGEDDPSGSADPRTVWGSGGEPSNANPYVENLDKKEQRMASKAMVDAILDGYGSLKKWSNNLIKLDPKKIKKAINEGTIDGSIIIPIGNGQQVPLMDYVEMYNAETAEVISMNDEFKEKVSPVLLRVLMKRGIGMTDEQLLAYYFGMDIITTGAQIFALRSQNMMLINQLKEMTESMDGAKTNTPPASSNTKSNRKPEPEPEPTQPVQSEPVTEYYEPEEVRPQAQSTRQTRPNAEYTQVEILDDLQPEPIKNKRKSKVVKSMEVPNFGSDSDILQHMEEIARAEAKGSNTVPPRKGRRKK